ncbi:hypothetical protein Tco_0422731 [Tanacetum coccineum]
MCMFKLTVSIVEPKNIKEAMVDSAWIEAMQDELHQFNRLKVWELVDQTTFGKNAIKLKCQKVSLLQIIQKKSTLLRKAMYGLKQALKTCLSKKVVRLGINPMIQPEPEDLPKDNPKLEIAVLRYDWR